MKRVRGKLSYANVVSTICLFVVLGGTAYAASQLPKNSVGTKQLKNGAVSLAKINSAAKSSLKGAAGPQGPQGAPGPAGAAGATKVVVREGEFEEGGAVASCNPGEVAVGGGGETATIKQLLWGSKPISEGGKPVAWFAGGETAEGAEVPVKAYVVCASP
jgi:hypothetical protein